VFEHNELRKTSGPKEGKVGGGCS